MERNKARVNVNGQNNTVNVNSTLTLNTAVDEMTKLMQAQDVPRAQELFMRMVRAASSQHPMYPHWRYELELSPDGTPTFSHVPTSSEAAIQYPLRGNVTVIVPEEYQQFGSMEELFKHSYGKQMPLTFNATAFKTMIGDYVLHDLQANEEHTYTVELRPQKFPDPRPCKLSFKNNSFSIDYLLMQVREIDGSVITFDNNNQENAKVFVTIQVNLVNRQGNFSIQIPDKYAHDVDAHYTLNKFLLTALEGDRFALKSLELGQSILEANEWQVNAEMDRDNLRRFVDVLSVLSTLQLFYNVHFSLPVQFEKQDMETIELLRLTSEGQSIDGTFSGISFTTNDRDTVRQAIELAEANQEGSKIDVTIKNHVINLFGASVECNVEASFNSAVVEDLDRLKKKYEIMDRGDSIEIRYIPGTDNRATERYIPQL